MISPVIRIFSAVYIRLLRRSSKARRVRDVGSFFGYDTNYPFY